MVTPYGSVLDSVTVTEEFDLAGIQTSGELIMATVSGPGTYYDYHGKSLGTQYLICQHFADSLGVRLRVEVYRDSMELIKKQQEASSAQGYSKGGFTGDGGKYEVAGVVHKGEWVASQELLHSPVARPMIEALDYAQRTNTIGSLRSEDVSRSIVAPSVYAQSAQPSQTVIVQQSGSDAQTEIAATHAALKEYAEVIRQLKDRLNEPFVTVNTVTGDTGIKQAQDEYEQLMRNKTPKSRRK